MSHHKDDSLGARNHVTYVPTLPFPIDALLIRPHLTL